MPKPSTAGHFLFCMQATYLLVVAPVVQKATTNLVPLVWSCLRFAVSMKLDFELDIAHKVGCMALVSFQAVHKAEELVGRFSV